MTSRQLVDPELLPILDIFPTHTYSSETLADIRGIEWLADIEFEDEGIVAERRMVPGPAGAPDVALCIYRPPGSGTQLRPCIYHIHGGGYIAGTARDFAFLHHPLAAKLDCVIVSVDYRIAPEAIYPAAIEDCYAGLTWTFEHAAEIGVDPARIGVMGESAGGGLAAALALMARDRGDLRLAFQHLIYPMLDDRTGKTDDPNPFAGEFVWTPAANRFGWAALLGREPGGDDVAPYAAPARATDLAGLPPTFMFTATLDLFVDENIEYARRLIRAGVPTEFHIYPGAFHGFHLFPSTLSSDANRDSHSALARFMRLADRAGRSSELATVATYLSPYFFQDGYHARCIPAWRSARGKHPARPRKSVLR